MYQTKPGQPLLNKKCFACKFCTWDSERQEESCDLYECINNCYFKEFKIKGDDNYEKT